MYLPAHFEEARDEELLRTIAAFPLGALVVRGPDGFDANHIPFLIGEGDAKPGTLLAHVARANPLWKDAKDGDEALVIFRAGDAYISPNWYPSKHELHRQVPTWNYRVVHVHGKLHIRDDERFVRGVVARLTRTHEAQAGSPRPWKMTDASPEYIEQMLANIVGIEIGITRMVGKWKLSQNKDERDRGNAADELRKRGEQEISQAMLGTIANEAGA
ncbi:MAG TPA: FMN-binding negative transcriptional regulator [Casimicrobiaceae bacterium]|nr:FMN-binding negative transcriptional regulator [Casimicrobiaceae bacterium]